MFQTFDSAGDPSRRQAPRRELREWLAANDLDGFIVPRADEHQGEYVAARSERLKWLTGFSGSAGVAHRAGRPRLHLCRRPLHAAGARRRSTSTSSRSKAWSTIRRRLDQGQSRQGRAARLRSVAAHDRRGQGAEGGGRQGRRDAGAARPATRSTASGRISPTPPLAPVEIHPIAFAGELAKDKLARLAARSPRTAPPMRC